MKVNKLDKMILN